MGAGNSDALTRVFICATSIRVVICRKNPDVSVVANGDCIFVPGGGGGGGLPHVCLMKSAGLGPGREGRAIPRACACHCVCC